MLNADSRQPKSETQNASTPLSTGPKFETNSNDPNSKKAKFQQRPGQLFWRCGPPTSDPVYCETILLSSTCAEFRVK
jgi:hypothetical protein